MKTSALRFLGFSLISIFCGTAAAYDANAKLEEIKTLQTAKPAEADQGSPYAKDVERLVKQRDSETSQAIAPIQKRFDLAAQQLLRKAIQAGNLDAANKIKAAIENTPELATLREEAQSPLDKEFLRLAEQREKDSAIAMAPAQKRFDLAAQQLIRKATQSGNLEAANELKAMIDEASGSAKDPKIASIKSTDPSSKSSSKYKECPEEDFEFQFDGESVAITKYIGNSDKVGVPAKIQGKPVMAIRWQAFKDNSNIEEIVLPETLEFIGIHAFQGCKNLSKINMPESLKTIRGEVVNGTALKKLSIPANVILLEQQVWSSNLESIEVDPENKNYVSIDGVVYDKNIKTLIFVPAGIKKKSLKVPNSVEKVIKGSMAGINPPWNRSSSQLKTIHIPKEAVIEEKAFAGSDSLKVVRY